MAPFTAAAFAYSFSTLADSSSSTHFTVLNTKPVEEKSTSMYSTNE